jgi:3-oxoacyl-(acyl-carrier-protein) synthase
MLESDAMKPIAITGIGIVSPVGICTDSFWNILTAPHDLRGNWTRGDLGQYPVRQVIEIPPAVWQQIRRPEQADGNRIADLAAHAIGQALDDARVGPGHGRLGCMIGTTTGGVVALEQALVGGIDIGAEAAEAAYLDASHLVRRNGRWSAPASVLSNACSSGLLAPALACDLIDLGEADAMIAGSVDTLLEYTVCGFNGLRLMADGPCRPFSAERNGVVLSEGCVVFCLEPLAAAHARGARIHGVIRGYGLSCDAQHVTAPDPAGVARAMAGALAGSGVRPGSIGAVFAHGTGTLANDSAETSALRATFGDEGMPPVTAIKSVMGHSQAAAGSFSLLAALLALEHGLVPPTAGVEAVDPTLGIDVVTGLPRPLQGDCVMVNAFGFGGNNGVMIVSSAAAARRLYRED